MNKLSKRDQMILVGLGALAILALLWYVLIQPQKAKLADSKLKANQARERLQKADRLIKTADAIDADLEQVRKELRGIEDGLAAGDLYSWSVLMVNRFRAPYKVEIDNFTRPQVGDMEIIPDFPYRAARFIVRGTAYYHDFGKFLADFENQFPYFRVQNVDLRPSASTKSAEEARATTDERLQVEMEIVVPIKQGLTP